MARRPIPPVMANVSHQEKIARMCSSIFTTKNRGNVVINVDELGEVITVTDPNGGEIGKIELQNIEYDDGECYKITWMYLNKQNGSYLHQGIGRAALKFHKEIFCAPIVASEDNGIKKNDGSHLTEDAPGFIAKMRVEGIVESCANNTTAEDDG